MESVSDGAWDVRGVSRAGGAGVIWLILGASGEGVETSDTEGSELMAGIVLGGSSTGSLGDWGAGGFRRLRRLLGGKAPSVNEYQGNGG